MGVQRPEGHSDIADAVRWSGVNVLINRKGDEHGEVSAGNGCNRVHR